MSCDLGWCHSCYHEGGAQKEEGRLLVGEGLNWRKFSMPVYLLSISLSIFHYIIDCNFIIEIQGTGGFLVKVPAVDQKLVGLRQWDISRAVWRCPWARYRITQHSELLSRALYPLWQLSLRDRRCWLSCNMVISLFGTDKSIFYSTFNRNDEKKSSMP